ncbi:hypothetical protein KY335_00250 [Candidatus Woesearchaeota archaeon]|nr:hypothetical protein [Candidatus Woesearchaeota archaeon]
MEIGEGEQKSIVVGGQEYLLKVNRIFRRQVSVTLPDGSQENFRIYDEKFYWFKDNHKFTLKLLGTRRTREGLVARFYAKDEEISNQVKPRISYSIDHDSTPPILEDFIETGETKEYVSGIFEHKFSLFFADTNYLVYEFDDIFRVDTTGGKIRLGASDDIIYLRITKIQKLNGRRHRVYFELFSPDFEVKLKPDYEKV